MYASSMYLASMPVVTNPTLLSEQGRLFVAPQKLVVPSLRFQNFESATVIEVGKVKESGIGFHGVIEGATPTVKRVPWATPSGTAGPPLATYQTVTYGLNAMGQKEESLNASVK